MEPIGRARKMPRLAKPKPKFAREVVPYSGSLSKPIPKARTDH
jgi:hypothetical protein